MITTDKVGRLVTIGGIALLVIVFFSSFKLILSFFNEYLGLFSLILFAAGFYLIWKQIKISKSQDILFRFQDLIIGYLTTNYRDHNQCYKEIDSILKRCLIIRDKNEINFIVQTNDSSNLGVIVENLISKYELRPEKNKLIKNACYELWLANDYKKFLTIVESDNFRKVDEYHKIYDEIVASLSKIEVLYSSEQSYKQIHALITEKIKHEVDSYEHSYNALTDAFNLFFKKTSRNKGIL